MLGIQKLFETSRNEGGRVLKLGSIAQLTGNNSYLSVLIGIGPLLQPFPNFIQSISNVLRLRIVRLPMPGLADSLKHEISEGQGA